MIQRMLRADYTCIILNFRFISHEIKKQNAITVNGSIQSLKFKKFENSKKMKCILLSGSGPEDEVWSVDSRFQILPWSEFLQKIIKYLLGTTSTFRTRSDFCCYKFQILLVFGGASHYNSHISATLHINRTFGTSWQLAFESLRACGRCSVPQQVCFSNGSIEAQSIEEQSQRGI